MKAAPMRTSEAALALITRVNSSGQTEYLTQWNDAWQAYSLIGGHVEDGETFRQCCIRETVEELECSEHDITAALSPSATLRFREMSRAAMQETDYHWRLFDVKIDFTVLQKSPETCTWILFEHAQVGRTAHGQPIADQVKRVLSGVDQQDFDSTLSSAPRP